MRYRFALLTVGVLVAGLLPVGVLDRVGAETESATPPSGTVGPAQPTATWTGSDRSAETDGPDTCDTRTGVVFEPFCSDFTLHVAEPGDVDVAIVGTVPANDFDLYVLDNAGQVVASSAAPAGIEATTVSCATPEAGPYTVRTVYFATVATPLPDDPGYRGEAAWSPPATACEPSEPIFDRGRSLAFGPATIASAHFLGSEPQTTLERELPGFESATDPKRIFVDWPLSSRSQMGQLSRSLDGGDSFRLLLDLRCSERNRPNCASGGGGDTEDTVNLHTGTVMFSDQEVVVNEAFAASFDHGDSFVSQTPVSNATTGTDRQWLTPTDASYGVTPLGPIEGFLTYHIPCAGQYIQGLQRVDTAAGPVMEPIPQAVPQIVNVGQSGQPVVDNNPASPGYGWVYQPFSSCVGIGQPAGSLMMGTAFGPDYVSPTAWQSNFVDATSPDIFSWSSVDDAGNAYVVWSTDGVMFLSASPIDDPRNDPRDGGRPGTFWTPRVKVTPPEIGSTVFPEIVAGSPGRVGIAYDATTEYRGTPDGAPPDTEWHTYAAVIENALGVGGPPVVVTGQVSHRFVHMGNVCTGGAGCVPPLDRSLLDMIDLGFDQSGRLGVVFTDNYTRSFAEAGPEGEDESPFTHFAKQTAGPRVLATHALPVPTPQGSCREDPPGDATWPNTAAGTNLPSLDVRRACLTIEQGVLVARITVANASALQRNLDLARFNAVLCLPTPLCLAERLQYVLRFSTATDIYHLSMEALPGGAVRFFAGLLDANDKILNPGNPTSSGVIAAGYHTDGAFPAGGQIDPMNNTIVIRAPAAPFGVGLQTPLFSVTGFSMAGPLESAEVLASDVMRTADASPPADLRLRPN